MTKNLLSYVSDHFSDNILSSIASVIGENAGTTKSAVMSAIPTILKGVINRGDTTENVTALRKFIGDQGLGGNLVSNIGNDSFARKGAGVVDFLFGSAKSTLLGNIGKLIGFDSGKTSSLVSTLAPLVISYVSKLGKEQNYTDAQFASYLDGQKSNMVRVAKGATQVSNSEGNNSGGGGLLKWLLPLLLIGAALWWFMNRDSGKEVYNEANTEVVSTNDGHDHSSHEGHNHASHDGHDHASHEGHDHASHEGHDHASHEGHDHAIETSTTIKNSAGKAEATVGDAKDAMNDAKAKMEGGAANADSDAIGFSVNDSGDLVDGAGKVIAKKGEFSVKGDEYVDAKGKRIGVLKKIGQAVGNAAEKTADAMKKVFSGMFKSKEKVGSTYMLNNIEFDNESHRITNFSKGEVEGLAAALKEMPDAKIQVQVHGDGNKVTDLRANVIRDMLTTLGVSKKQISAKGMGDKDAAKAKSGSVEIAVEQTVK